MRLNSNHRDALYKFVRQQIVGAPALIKKRDVAYAVAARDLTAALEKRFPAADIAVLLKYDLAERDNCIRIKTGEGSRDVEEFTFADDTGPMRPTYGGCRIFDFGDKVTASVLKWRAAETVLAEDRDARVEAYNALIHGAQTDVEVLKVWPEAKTVFDKFNSNLPAQLTTTHLQRIRADLAERAAA